MQAVPPSRCVSGDAGSDRTTDASEHHRSKLAFRAGVAAAAASSAALGGAFALMRAITGPGHASTYSDYIFTPFEMGINYETVTVAAPDGTALKAWWLPQGTCDRVVIGCPYYRGHKAGLMGIASVLWRAGFSVFLFDYRGHGEHVGTPVTLGYHEVDDLLAAVETVRCLAPKAAVGAIGYSMGAAVAIMGAARQPSIQAVVADSGFARQSDAIRSGVRQQLRVPIDPLLPLIDLLVHQKLGYHFRDVEPLRDVAALAGRPLLIIHGMQDAVVNVTQAELLYEAAQEPKALWLLPDVGHCGAYFADRQAYCTRVVNFFDQALPPKVEDDIVPPAVFTTQAV